MNAYGQKEYVDQFWRFLGHFTKLEMRFKWKSPFDLFSDPCVTFDPLCCYRPVYVGAHKGSYWLNMVKFVACQLVTEL